MSVAGSRKVRLVHFHTCLYETIIEPKSLRCCVHFANVIGDDPHQPLIFMNVKYMACSVSVQDELTRRYAQSFGNKAKSTAHMRYEHIPITFTRSLVR